VPVYNMSRPLTLTLQRIANGNYVFDDQTDPYYIDLGGFFPIDGQLFGDTAGAGGGGGGGGPNLNHNFYFTFEIHTEFVYDASVDQSFKFDGTDTVWLYVDGMLVNDLHGVHAAHDQYVDVHRMGLVDGESYQLDFFFAQRYEPSSHFRIETSLVLESLPISTVSAVYD
jgi:fibro-slime domain-containing protein